MKMLRNPILWGCIALAIATVVGLVAAVVYVTPPGQKTVTFYTDDALSVRPGDDVRIAGIKIGKVRKLALEAKRVRVSLRVDDTAFVGDQSQVEVRMLTVVGGYYVNIISLGDSPLGDNVIPVERSTMPYSLMRALVDTTKITDNVKPKPFKESLDQIAQGLEGTNVESLTSIIEAGNNMMSTIDRQRGQISAILNLSDEWIESLADFGDELRDMVGRLAILEQTLKLYATEFTASIVGIASVLDQLTPALIFYRTHKDEFLERTRRYIEKAQAWTDRQGAVIRTARLMRNKIERLLDAQSAPPQLLATDMCFPLPGAPC
jgi:virulence factor Mce-like protein